MRSDRFKGYFFAIIGTLAFSNEYIFSKAAMNEVHLAQFGVYWFAISTVLIFLYALSSKSLSQIKFLTRRQVRILVTLGFLEIVTTTTFYLSIHIIPDPAVTSFLGNMYPVMLALGGIVVLGEKFGPVEIFGAFLALAGAFIIGYTGETELKKLFIPGTGVVLLNAFFATVASLVVKVHVRKLSPELLNLNRSVWLLVFSFIMFFVYRQSFAIPLSALKNIAVGATLGPFLAILTIYYSFRYLEASRSSVVQSLKGIFVLLGAYLFFGTLPLAHQLLGGFLTVIGVLVMTLARAGLIRRK
ncbi:MAG TPA: DMT family transporter [Mariniphaga anaerophila]|uniref:DMT family transporter n=1 Tax=Mariniphaga anaerophila TaxID=1484053 RepID=A0A831LIT8_9BACT|nr:DMT family transporter [Mariniphaga anaerophila]